MVILFVTSGLEPGKDGVGDYTRLLAAECIRQGARCHLLALNDRFISQPVEAVETANNVSLSVLRLPSELSWEKRVELATEFRTRCAADWTSLQFVGYGFHHKGVVRKMERYFRPIIGGLPLHVMFHETWIGQDRQPTPKDYLVGQIQRYYLRDLFRKLAPRLITTSNPFYVALLRGIGMPAIETPLFCNIAMSSADGDLDIPPQLIEAGIGDERGRHEGRLLGLFFGALYPDWEEKPLIDLLIPAPEKSGKRPCLVSAGRMGGAGTERWKEMQIKYGHAIDFVALGECTAAQISSLMHAADFGVAATPWYLLGKSSTAATMLDHGLPVIVTSFDYQPPIVRSRPDDPLLHRADETLKARLWAGLPRRPAHNGIVAVAETLLAKMGSAS